MVLKLNIGCGTDIKEGFVNTDKEDFDIEKDVWPYKDSSVDFIWAHHILEHVSDFTYVMKEMHRVCKNGATIDIEVPLAHTLWDVANPTHKTRFNHKTFECYSVDHSFADVGIFQGFKIVSQNIQREPDETFQGINWIVANLRVILKVVKGA